MAKTKLSRYVGWSTKGTGVIVILRGSKYSFVYPSFAVTEASGHGIKDVAWSN